MSTIPISVFQPEDSVFASATIETAEDRDIGDCRDDAAKRARLDAMSAMASTIAHELSQPLSAVQNYLMVSTLVLRERPHDDPELAQALECAAEQATRAVSLIRRTREFVRSGRVQTEASSVREMLHYAIASVEELSGVELVCELSAKADLVMADRVHIETVIINLLRNATQAMRKQEATPRIRVTSFDRDGAVFLRIADNGPGIDPEILPRVFEPGFTTRPSASGLGLSICHTFVDAHRGALWVDKSEAGEGAVFVLGLPAA